MKNNYNYKKNNNGTITVLNGIMPVTAFSKIPPRLIQIIADHFSLKLYGEISQYNGKRMFKVGLSANDQGGIINVYTTYSRAAFNRFVCSYKS